MALRSLSLRRIGSTSALVGFLARTSIGWLGWRVIGVALEALDRISACDLGAAATTRGRIAR
jgi:hypothetical protein